MSSSNSMYNLHTLGWASFQNLCGTILRELLGQTYEVFADSADAGIDGAFHGKWKAQGDEDLSGSFVVQCKFNAKQGAVFQPSQLNGEIEKVRRLAHRGRAQNYILMTNGSMRTPVEDELRKQVLAIRGVKRFRAFGGEWITQQIREKQRLRTLVPRVYGLGDLTEILDDRVYEQAREILSRLGDELERFVVTEAHHRSVQALTERGFVFLLGEPGSGKSTIAEALALAAADTWQSRVIKVLKPSDFTKHWNPREPNQFFWVDDAFGQTQYERERALEWNYALRPLSAALKQGARAIFTSRTYIYKAAVSDLKESLFPLLRESKVVIEVEKLTEEERQQILYNHLRLGNQSVEFRRSLKDFLPEVAAHDKFMPESARRLGGTFFTKGIAPTRESVLHFIAEPEEYLRDVITGAGDDNRAALSLIFIRGGKINAPLDLSQEEEQVIQVMNSSIGEVRKSFQALEGSLITRELEDGEQSYRFKHPTIRDAFSGVIGDDPNLMDVYLKGARPESLGSEITCGDVGLEGARLIVPTSRFELVERRLRELMEEPGGMANVASFLSTRCSIDFVRNFLRADPDFLSSQKFKFGYYIIASTEGDFFGFLHSHNLLPESERKRFIEFACRAAIYSPEWRFMQQPKLRSLFLPSELRSLRARVRRELTAARLKIVRDAWKVAWEESGEQDPENFFWSLERELNAFAFEFRQNQSLRARFKSASKKLKKMKEKLKKDWEEKEGELSADKKADEVKMERSLFDDVDE